MKRERCDLCGGAGFVPLAYVRTRSTHEKRGDVVLRGVVRWPCECEAGERWRALPDHVRARDDRP